MFDGIFISMKQRNKGYQGEAFNVSKFPLIGKERKFDITWKKAKKNISKQSLREEIRKAIKGNSDYLTAKEIQKKDIEQEEKVEDDANIIIDLIAEGEVRNNLYELHKMEDGTIKSFNATTNKYLDCTCARAKEVKKNLLENAND